jgi:hypothetical protein
MSLTYQWLFCQINELEEQQEETKGQTDSRKAACFENGKAPAHGYPGRFGTLGRFESKESAHESACT